MWFKRTKFDFLKDIDLGIHRVVTEFQEIDSIFRRKLAAFNNFKENSNKNNLNALQSEMRLIEQLLKPNFVLEVKETRAVSKIVEDIDRIIQQDFSRNRTEKLLKYQEYKNLITLKHLLESYSDILLKQRQFMGKNKTIQSFQKNIDAFAELIEEEAKIIGMEEQEIPALAKETEEVVEKEETSFDITLIGYGSLMQAKQVAKELEQTLGRSVSADEFKLRVVPVLVYGWKRIFDKVMTRGVWETEADKAMQRIAALNIHPSPFHYFNAVAIKLTTQEFQVFVEREKNYGILELTDVRHFITGERLKERCICFKSDYFRPFKIGEDDPILKELHPWPRNLVKSTITPAIKYYATCVAGARGLDSLLNSPGMFLTFLKTTYLYYWDKNRVYHGEMTVLDLRKLRDVERTEKSSTK